MIDMQTLVFDPVKGHDISVTAHKVDFNPGNYKTKAGAAKGLYEALRKCAKAEGQNPDIEVAIYSPEQNKERGYGNGWSVCWEAGPFEWAVGMSFELTGPWGFTEPYWSFDLHFTD